MEFKRKVTGSAKWNPETSVLTIMRDFINGRKQRKRYTVARILDHPAIPGPAFSLTQPDGEVYVVARTEHGVECTCADWNYRRQNEQSSCKHSLACQAVGLIAGSRESQTPGTG